MLYLFDSICIGYNTTGTVEIDGTTFHYIYDTRHDNRNKFTVQQLSSEAHSNMKMPVSKSYFEEFQLFRTFFGESAYADKWFEAAYNKVPTKFNGGRGDSDFTVFVDRMGQGRAMETSVVAMHMWMHIVRHLSAAVELCGHGTAKAMQELDQAVALYTGSLTARAGGHSGVLLYGLSQELGRHTKTSGFEGGTDSGPSHNNVEIIAGFKEIQKMLGDNSCSNGGLQNLKATVVSYMKVPLIQGLLRSTYSREFDAAELSLDDNERAVAESATYATALLPFVHECDADAAQTLHELTKIDAITTDFKKVKKALEKTYGCMNLTCEMVGGVWDRPSQVYRRGGEPCGFRRGGSGIQRSGGGALLKAGLSIFVVAILGLLLYKFRHVVQRMAMRSQEPSDRHISPVAEIM